LANGFARQWGKGPSAFLGAGDFEVNSKKCVTIGGDRQTPISRKAYVFSSEREREKTLRERALREREREREREKRNFERTKTLRERGP